MTNEPRWLTDEEQAAWMALAGMTMWLPPALDAQLRADAGISHAEYQVLSWLSMSPEHTTRMSTLAAAANVNLSHLSRIVARLELRGWMRREPDPVDGRYTLAILTDDGWDKVVATAPGHVEAVQHYVFDNLSATQVRQLREIGERVMRVVKPGTDHVPPQMRRD